MCSATYGLPLPEPARIDAKAGLVTVAHMPTRRDPHVRPDAVAAGGQARTPLEVATASGAPCDAPALLAALTLIAGQHGSATATDVSRWADLVNRAELNQAQVAEVVAAVLASPSLARGPALFGPGGWLRDDRFTAELLDVGAHSKLSGRWVATLLAACQRSDFDVALRVSVANRVGARFPFEIKRDFAYSDRAALFELADAGASCLVRLANPQAFLSTDALPLVVAHPGVARALASRLLTLRLSPRVSATCTLLLVHPSAGLPASLRVRLMRHLRSVHNLDWNPYDSPYATRVLTLASFAASLDHATGADLSGLDEPALMSWMALHAGQPDILDEALVYALGRRGGLVPAELTRWVFGRPGGNGSPSVQWKVARASSTFALSRVSANDPYRAGVLLERAQAGDGEAYLLLDPDARTQVEQAAVDTMSWAQLDRGRVGILGDMVAYGVALAGPVGAQVVAALAPGFRGCVGDLRAAVSAALSNPASGSTPRPV